MHTHRLLEVMFVLLGAELGEKINTLGRCESCVYVCRQRCRLTRWERSQQCGVVILYRKVNFPGESLKIRPYTQVWFLSVSSDWRRTHNPGDGVCHSFAFCRAAASSLPDHSSVPGGQPGGQSHHWWVGWKGWGAELSLRHCVYCQEATRVEQGRVLVSLTSVHLAKELWLCRCRSNHWENHAEVP